MDDQTKTQETGPAPTTTSATTSSGSKNPARQKFAKLTNGRVTRAILALRVVGNIAKLTASKNQLSDRDVERIMTAIEAEVSHCRMRLAAGATGQQLDVEFDVS